MYGFWTCKLVKYVAISQWCFVLYLEYQLFLRIYQTKLLVSLFYDTTSVHSLFHTCKCQYRTGYGELSTCILSYVLCSHSWNYSLYCKHCICTNRSQCVQTGDNSGISLFWIALYISDKGMWFLHVYPCELGSWPWLGNLVDTDCTRTWIVLCAWACVISDRRDCWTL